MHTSEPMPTPPTRSVRTDSGPYRNGSAFVPIGEAPGKATPKARLRSHLQHALLERNNGSILFQHVAPQTSQELRDIIRAIRPDLPAQDVAFWSIVIQGVCTSYIATQESCRRTRTECGHLPDSEEVVDRFTEFAYQGLLHADDFRLFLVSHILRRQSAS